MWLVVTYYADHPLCILSLRLPLPCMGSEERGEVSMCLSVCLYLCVSVCLCVHVYACEHV